MFIDEPADQVNRLRTTSNKLLTKLNINLKIT
jgi:hypothetical protein